MCNASKLRAYTRDFEETKYMSSIIKNGELLEIYNEIWDKISNTIIKIFESGPVCNEKHLKTRLKSYEERINTNLHDNKISKKGSQCICLCVILIDSVYRSGKNYYPQVFLEECKYDVKEKKMSKYITEDTKIFSDEENSDQENSDKENSDQENFGEED